MRRVVVYTTTFTVGHSNMPLAEPAMRARVLHNKNKQKFKTRFHYVTLAGLELPLQTKAFLELTEFYLTLPPEYWD